MRYTMLLLAAMSLALPSLAALPDEVYRDRIVGSEIQAIAVSSDIRRTGEDGYSEKFVATFTVEKTIALEEPAKGGPLTEAVRSVWKGPPDPVAAGVKLKVSYATLKKGAMPPPGYPVTFEVREGERVYVTISDSGELTSCTPLTPELEKALSARPPKVRIRANRIEPRE